MAHPAVGFTLCDGERRLLSLAPAEGELFAGRLKRLGALMGREFADNALLIEALREGIRLTGYPGLPTRNRANARSEAHTTEPQQLIRHSYADFSLKKKTKKQNK